MRLKTAVTPRLLAGAADLRLVAAGELGQAGVGEAHHLELAQAVGGRAGRPSLADCGLGVDDLADAGEEPGVEGGDRR